MKKNKMMRLASAMMVMTLMTTSVISGTFAKYVTSDSASDTARVAKWGITIQAGGNLFGTDYAAKEAAENSDSIVVATSQSVSSSNTDNIVAPGTKNSEGYTVAIKGTPEVAYEVSAVVDADVETVGIEDVQEIYLKKGTYGVMVKAEGLNAATEMDKYYTRNDVTKEYDLASNFESGKNYYELHDSVTLTEDYYPITWTIAEDGVTNIDKSRLDEIATEMVTNLINSKGDAKDPTNFSYKLTWEWKFENGNTEDAKVITNGADTILGNLMAGLESPEAEVVKVDSVIKAPTVVDDYNLNVAFGLKVTVTQID